ncbi:unnamed protein product [Microthlaspi erraticum]|uniref:Uncharacterized protein n=1 Tax=Microthlaspi erraticum TaxID=1685480 RepID=A0A6D2JD64_9BRAS|nr:unnamed protein product [Microthlaspi erraticum]
MSGLYKLGGNIAQTDEFRNYLDLTSRVTISLGPTDHEISGLTCLTAARSTSAATINYQDPKTKKSPSRLSKADLDPIKYTYLSTYYIRATCKDEVE